MVAVKSGQPIPRRSVALNPSPRSNAASILDRHGSLGSVIWLRLSVRVAIPANDLDEIASPHCLPQGSGLHHDSRELRPAVEFALQNPFAPTTMSQMGPFQTFRPRGCSARSRCHRLMIAVRTDWPNLSRTFPTELRSDQSIQTNVVGGHRPAWKGCS